MQGRWIGVADGLDADWVKLCCALDRGTDPGGEAALWEAAVVIVLVEEMTW